MYIFTLLYTLLIGPLELFFEVLYSLSHHITKDPALSIVLLSLAMNFLVLPLYRRADAVQEEQRDRALAMKPWTDHIKNTFSGDERFMMLQTYNRQNGYKQTDVLKGSISLLLEIPFFIAAFHFLSHLELLNGVALGPIRDLGTPDGLLHVGGFSINLLPILMTAINVVSAAIYLKGFPLTSKIQTYGIAAIFLILLYNSPAGLVFYWTLNNIFSLVKNIFYKLKNAGLVLAILASLAGITLFIILITGRIELSFLRIFIFGGLALALQMPLVLRVIKKKGTPPRLRFSIPAATPADDRTFFLGCLFLALLTGLLVPLTVVNASPGEFVNVSAYRSPLWYMAESLALAVGTFIVWCGVFYRLATPRGKTIFGVIASFVVIGALINYLFFGLHYGNLTAELRFTELFEVTGKDKLINILVLTAAAAILLILWVKKRSLLKIANASLVIAVVFMAGYTSFTIETSLEKTRQNASALAQKEAPSIPLSTNGKNVVVIMIDRALPQMLPYIFNEKPELKDAFAGFTSYMNTISYGPITNIGTPALFGGPDYRPAQMNERGEEALEEKQNEALHVMPKIFTDNGFNATIFDPTYAGYEYTPDLSVFDDLENTKSFITLNRSFINAGGSEEDIKQKNSEMARNFFCYSIFKIAPVALQPTLYQEGTYNSTSPLTQIRESVSVSYGIDPWFNDSYRALENYSKLTTISHDNQNNYIVMTNNATHEATVLSEPEYEPANYVNNLKYDAEHAIRYDSEGRAMDMFAGTDAQLSERITLYQVNMATWIKLGEWFNYLRDQGLYDNTRIILVSDHAWEGIFGDDLVVPWPTEGPQKNPTIDLSAFNCLLLVKDFNAKDLTFNNQFMTNADVPSIAFSGLIDNPTNPYTGNSIDESYKTEADSQQVLYSLEWNVKENNGNTFLPGHWYTVHDDCRIPSNWEYAGSH